MSYINNKFNNTDGFIVLEVAIGLFILIIGLIFLIKILYNNSIVLSKGKIFDISTSIIQESTEVISKSNTLLDIVDDEYFSEYSINTDNSTLTLINSTLGKNLNIKTNNTFTHKVIITENCKDEYIDTSNVDNIKTKSQHQNYIVGYDIINSVEYGDDEIISVDYFKYFIE